MKIITLIEDSQIDGHLGAEHGLSFYMETEKHKILFDVGQSSLFACNARRLHIDLSLIDTVVISHGHYDHGGGLEDLIRINNHAKIYIQKSAFDKYYSMRKENEYTYIGLSEKLDLSRFILLDDDYRIDDELMIINQIETKTFFPNSNHTMFKKVDGKMVLDDFKHEQSLLVTSKNQNVLCTGCSHKGIVNIINQTFKHLKHEQLDYVFGGFHLKSRFKTYEESVENIIEIAHVLKSKPVFKYYTGHCTGIKAFEIMKPILDLRLNYFYPGCIIE
jgi:7,8-dihydropterin-6-yl-methyl-4-(beta-D-ribofuranosyl)aminobenzene 5'-phosphate synthase